MTARGMSSNYRKGNRKFEKSKTSDHEDLKKNQYAFCREEGHWKIDCPKIKPKKKQSKLEANIAHAHGNDSDLSGYSLSITPISCYSEKSEEILNTSATYHLCPKWEGFASFEKNQMEAWCRLAIETHARLKEQIQFASSCLME